MQLLLSKSYLYKILILIVIGVFSTSVYAQNATVSGLITDSKTGEPLIGVNILVKGNGGTATDLSGNYMLEVPSGRQVLVISYLSYETQEREINLSEKEVLILDISLSERAKDLGIIVVSGSKFEKKLEDEVMSIDVIQPKLIENKAATNLSDIVKTVPGVQILDGQASIRGGSGYAYGVGSRVMVVVDGQPMITGDRGDVKWNFIPIENAEQIEVVKGSSSVLYGASALNGVVHIKTSEAKSEPYTKLMYYGKVIGKPKREGTAWWNNNPMTHGLYFAHRQKFGNVDLVLGANLQDSDSHLFGADEERARVNAKIRVRAPKNDKLTFGINTNYTFSREGLYVIWNNAEEGIYKPLDGTSGRYRYMWYNFDPWVNYYDRWNNKHSFKARYFGSLQITGSAPVFKGEGSVLRGDIANADYQFQRTFKKDLNVILGTTFNYLTVRNKDLGNHDGTIFAAYTQIDKKFNRLSLSAGTRLEKYNLDTLVSKLIPSFRLGANMHIGRNSHLRASFGQGYRFPGAAERFVDIKLGEYINVFPNEQLRPETGWSSEIGLKQVFNHDKFTWSVDAALFWSEYKDMVEFSFGVFPEIEAPSIIDKFGFKSLNISNARIAGLELSTNGSGKISEHVNLEFYAGYTYIYPVDLNKDTTLRKFGNYISGFGSAFVSEPGEESLNPILKYRYRHSASGDVNLEWKKFTFGAGLQFYSYMERIDSIFEGEGFYGPLVTAVVGGAPIPGVKEWREENNGGKFILSTRVAYNITDKIRVMFLVDNLLNEEYAIRPAKLEAPRNFTFQYSWRF